MASLLVVSTESVDGIVTVTCSGELHDALGVASAIEASVADGSRRVCIDCSALDFATADGMRDLLKAINRCDEIDVPVELILSADGGRFLDLVSIELEAAEDPDLKVFQGPVGQPVG